MDRNPSIGLTPSPKTLDIVIVNWNAGLQLKDCLASIAAADLEGIALDKVIVVDNGSTDGSVAHCNAPTPATVIIENRCNRGFSRACNQGAAAGTSDFILFLNPDIRLFRDSLVVPLEFMDRTRRRPVGIVGVQLVDDRGVVARSCARFPTPKALLGQMTGLDRIFPDAIPGHFLRKWDHRENRCVDQVMGAFFMTRRQLFNHLGGFDERFFVYYEDMDFSLRAKNAGYLSWFVGGAAAFHKGCGTSDPVRAGRLFYYLRSRIQYGFKHFGRYWGTALLIATLAFEPLARLTLACFRRSAKEFVDTLHGVAMLVGDLPVIIRGAQGHVSAPVEKNRPSRRPDPNNP